MASAKEIALLERKLKSAKTNREKIVLAKELKDLKSKLTTTQKKETLPTQRRKIRMLSSAEFNELIARLKQNPEYSFLKSMGKKKIEDDYRVVGKPVGWRIKGKDNYKVPSKKFRAENPDLVYFENRINRSDVRKPNRLEHGGSINKDGMMHFVLNEMSSGFIANHSNADKYAETSLIRSKMIEILKKDGDSNYSLSKAIALVKKAEASSKYATGGMMARGGSIKIMGITFKNTFGIDQNTFENAIEYYYDTASRDQVERISARSFLRKLQQELGDEKNKEVMSYIQKTFADNEIYATGGSLKKKSKETGYIWKINQDIESRSGNNEPTFEVGKIKGYENALKTRSALQEGSPDNFKYSIKATNKYAKGGIVVTSIKDIPNFKQKLDEGKITYRGLGLGKLYDDFYKIAGTSGTRIKVNGKEYFITDEEFDTFSRGTDGKMRIRFDAPKRKGYARGGGLKKKGKSQPAVTSNAVQPKYADYNVQLVESQDENNKGTYYMFPKPADKNSRGILFEKGGMTKREEDTEYVFYDLFKNKARANYSKFCELALEKGYSPVEIDEWYEKQNENEYAKGGEIKVGDWVKSKKGKGNAKGKVYKELGSFIYLEDEYGNQNTFKLYPKKDFVQSVKPRY